MAPKDAICATARLLSLRSPFYRVSLRFLTFGAFLALSLPPSTLQLIPFVSFPAPRLALTNRRRNRQQSLSDATIHRLSWTAIQFLSPPSSSIGQLPFQQTEHLPKSKAGNLGEHLVTDQASPACQTASISHNFFRISAWFKKLWRGRIGHVMVRITSLT